MVLGETAACGTRSDGPCGDRSLPCPCAQVPKLPGHCKGFLWDRTDWGVLLAHGAHTFSVYLYTAHSIAGPSLTPVRTCKGSRTLLA